MCDLSRALINACGKASTGIETIEIYAEIFRTEELLWTYIRIDVAHYMKNWTDFSGSEKKEAKSFTC